jgi:hypothetical protein
VAKTTEERFEEIAEAAVREAEKVRCPFHEFVSGLEAMMSVLRERHNLAISEAVTNDDKEDES